MMAMGVGALIGAFAGLYLRVFILVPLTVVALLGTGLLDAADGLPLRASLLQMAYVWVGLQFAYLVSSFSASIFQSEFWGSTKCENVPNNIFAGDQNAIREHALVKVHEAMEVVGSDGQHVGTVDCKRDDCTLVLSGDDPKSGGRPHLISVEWIDHVDGKVHLNKPTNKAVSEWRLAA